MSTLAALPIRRGRALHVRPLAYALARIHPGLLAALAGERGDEAARAAAADILDDLLTEAADEAAAAADLAEVAWQ